MFGGSAGDAPELLKPLIVVFLFDSTLITLKVCWLSVATWFPLHQNEFDVIFDYRIRLIGFAKKFAAVLNFITGIGNLMPDDRI